MKTCIKCNSEFEPNGNAQKYCYRCLIKNCAWCGNPFISKNRHINQKYCSIACKEAVKIGKPTYPNITGKRGSKPRTYHLTKREKYGNIFDRDWRIKIFERDNYTCQECNNRGGRLQAHHIKSYREYPELRHDLDNGETLCIDCHKQTDTYGWSKYWHKKYQPNELSKKHHN